MTCILPKKEANMEGLIFYESYFRIFWKRQNYRDVKNISSYQGIGITKERDK